MKNGSAEKTVRNEILSLLSILSIVLVFAAVCGSILALLLQFGAIGLPGFLSDETIDNKSENNEADVLSLLHDSNGFGKELYVPEADGNALKKLIAETVSSDIIYMRLSCVKVFGDDSTTGIFDVWRYGEKFRIAEYDTSGAKKYDIIFNGEVLKLINSDGEEVILGNMKYYDISPLPDISSILSEDCNMIYTNSDGDEYEVILDNKETNETFDIKISMSEARLISLKQFENNSTSRIIEVLLFSKKIDEDIFS